MEELDLGGELSYREKPVRILDTAERVTRNKVICARFSGVITLRMKQLGSTKKGSEQITPSYS
jgi:hypothetical protein